MEVKRITSLLFAMIVALSLVIMPQTANATEIEVEFAEFSFNVADTSDGKVYAIGGWENAGGLVDQGSNKSKINTNVKLTYNLPENVEAGNYALSFDYLSAYPSSSSSTNHPYLQIFVDGTAVTDVIELNRTAKDWNNAITTAEPYDSYTDDEILIPITADSELVTIQVHNGSSLTTAGLTDALPSGFVTTTENSFTFTKIPEEPSAIEIAESDFTFDLADKVYTGLAITPAVTSTLSADVYEVAYTSNTEVGIATIIVTGKGNYTGTVTKTFNIVAGEEPVEPAKIIFDAADTADGKVYDIAGNVYAAGLTDQGSNKSKIYANVKLAYNLPEDIESGNYALSFDYLSAYPSSSSSTNHPYLQIFVDGTAVTDVIELNRTAKDWNNAISNAETYDSYADDEILIPITADSETVMIQVHNTSSLTTAGVTSPVPSGFVVTTENSFTFTKVSDIVVPEEPIEPEEPEVPEEPAGYSFNAADTADGKVYDGAGTVEYASGLTDKGSNKSWIYTNVRLTYNLPEDMKAGNYALSFDYLSAYPSSSENTNQPALQIFVDDKAVTDVIFLERTSKDWNNAITNAEHYDSYAEGKVLIPITKGAKTVSIRVHNTSSLTSAGHTDKIVSQFAITTENSFTLTDVTYPVNYEAEIKSFQPTINETDKTIDVKLKAENKLGDETTLKIFVIVALYDADGSLITCKPQPVELEAGVPYDSTSVPLKISFSSESNEVERVKVFLWGGSGFNDSNRKSYATAVELIR